MKKAIAAVAGLLLGVCVSAQAGHRTEVEVTPSTEPHQFIVAFKIFDVAKDGKMELRSAPTIVVEADHKGTIKIGDENEQSGVVCTALVKEIGDSIEVTTTVAIKKKGSEELTHAQIVTLKR